MPLTDAGIRSAKPTAKPFKIYDGQGLFLLVAPESGKLWRFRYRFDGKEKLLALGSYPDTSLKVARDRRDAARKQIAEGIDPSALRRDQKSARIAQAANSFEVIAREWRQRNQPQCH
jgi:hypothetical protein